MSMTLRISLLILFIGVSYAGKGLSCMDKSNNEVPWFFNIKFPYSVTSTNFRFGYLDSNSGNSGFQVLSGYVNSTGYSLSNTINYINSFSGISLVAFNDETPEGKTSSSNAHAKGVVAYDEATQTGVYLMHSIPSYPNVTTTGQVVLTLPTTATTYGQHIFCLSFTGESIADITHNLGVVRPILYYQSGIFANANFRLSGINSTIKSISLQDGSEVTFLSKSPQYTDGFLYENIVEPYINAGMQVESWGRPYQDSFCSPYNSLNILSLKFSNGDTWGDTYDHSKWGVSIGGSAQYACGCDVNRMTSQAKRGGSCICSTNSALNYGLRHIISSVQSCNATHQGFIEEKIEIIEGFYKKFLGN